MKKILIITLFALSLLSCNELERIKEEQKERKRALSDSSMRGVGFGYSVVVIDSCEYIQSPFTGTVQGTILTHKQNCRFCLIRK